AAVVDADWRLLLGLEGCEIGGGDEAPGGFETRREPPRQTAAVEGFRAVGGDLFERAGKIGLDDRGAERRRRAAREERRGARRVGQERGAMLVGEVAIAACRAKAVAGESDRFGEEIAPRQAAKALVHLIEAGERARNRNRERPDARNAARIALERGGG